MPSKQFQSFASGLAILVGAILTSAGTTYAAPLYWDLNGTAPGSGGPTPSGIWDDTTANWSTSADGVLTTGTYVAGSDVFLSAGIDATGTYTITVAPNPPNSTPALNSLNFQEGHIVIAPTTVGLSAESITFSGNTAATINVQNMDSTIRTKISAGGNGSNNIATGLIKTGVGKLALDFSSAGVGNYFNLTGRNLTINGGTVEITSSGAGAGANQLGATGVIINSGGTFRYGTSSGNTVSDSLVFTINTGGTLAGGGDQVGGFQGTGLIQVSGNFNLAGATATFGGLITGTGSLTYSAVTGTNFQTLTGVNTYTGNTSALAGVTGTGGIRLGNKRAAQNSTLNLVNTAVTTVNISFSSGIGTFVVGGLQGTSNLVLQDAGATAITLQAGNNDTATNYSGVLSGSGGLTKIGLGTLALSGTNTYTGDTTINAASHNAAGGGAVSSTTAATLQLNFNGTGAPAANIVNSASRLVLGGGRLLASGNNTANASQTFSSTQLNAGRSYVTVALGTGNNGTVVNLGNITRDAGSLVEFTLPGQPQSTTNGITTTRSNDASGILGAWAVTGADWAVNSAGTGLGNIAAYAGYSTFTTGDLVSSATSNVLVNNTETALSTAAGITDVNTLMVRNSLADGATVNRTLDVAAGETLRVGATGGIWNQGAGTLTIGTAVNVGTLTAGGAAGVGGEILVHTTGAGEVTVNSAITDNGVGNAVSLVKTGGGGQLTLNGTNTYTGGTFVTQGRLRVSTSASLGSGTVTVMPGGQAWLNASSVFSNNFVISGTGIGEGTNGVGPGAIRLANGTTLGKADGSTTVMLATDARIGGNSSTATVAAKITGDYAIDFTSGGGTGTGASIFTLTNTGNDFTGNLSLNGIVGTGALIATYSAFGASPVTVRLGASEVIPNGVNKGNVVLTGGAAGSIVTLDLNGNSETVNGLVSQGTAANTFVTNNASGTGTATLTLGDNNATAIFGGTIKDGATAKVALTKVGEGLQTLNGTNTYSGPTTISKGILQAAGTNVLSANSAVVIANDPTAMLSLTNTSVDFSQTIGSLAGGGTVNLGTSAATPAAGAVLTTGGDNSSTTYSGTIVGAGGLTKQGTGTFTLSGANTYLGPTRVNSGTLLVAGSITGTSGVNVTAGAFGGTGVVTGPVTVATGASLQGGDGLAAGDNLEINGDVNLASNAVIKLTLGVGLTHSTLTRNGGSWVFDSNLLFTFTGTGFTTGTYDNIITGLTGGEAWLADLSGWQITNAEVTGTFTKDLSNNIDLTITAVPEPGALLSLSGGLALLLGLRRRRR